MPSIRTDSPEPHSTMTPNLRQAAVLASLLTVETCICEVWSTCSSPLPLLPRVVTVRLNCATFPFV